MTARAPSVLQTLWRIPRLTAADWRQLGPLLRWLVLSRAAVLALTLGSVLVAGLFAVQSPDFDGVRFGLCALGLLLAHAVNNQLNDLIDHRRGIDKDNPFRRQYGLHVLEEGLLTPRRLLLYSGITGAVAAAIGTWLVLSSGSVAVALLFAAGALLVVAYTHPLKGWGLGEATVLLVWGPLMTGGTVLVATGHWAWDAAWAGTLYALGPLQVIFGKHIDKLDADAARGVGTLPVRLGEGAARNTMAAIVVMQYLALLGLVLQGTLPWPTLLAGMGLPYAWRYLQAARTPRPDTRPDRYPEEVWPLWFAAMGFVHTRWFGTGLFLGLLLALWPG